MSSGQKRALQSDGVGETFSPPADLIRIAEEDPEHPHHDEHMRRVSSDDPDNQALLASLREFGWRKAITMSVYLDGDGYSVSDGRRRLTMVRIENERRKKDRDKRGPIRPRVVIDDQPMLTTTMTNAMRKDDPPMVKARRFVENSVSMGASAAARAAGFLTLAEANACKTILQTPDASLHAAVNSGEVTVDTAARAAKKGQATVRKVLTRARASGDGKVTEKGAKEAVKAEVKPRAKTRPAPVLASIEAAARKAVADRPAVPTEDTALADALMLGLAEGMTIARGGSVPDWAVSVVKQGTEAAKKGAGEVSARPKGTKYIRVRIDFSIELKEPTDNSAMVDAMRFHRLAHDKLLDALRETDTHDRAIGTAPGFTSSMGLDKRKRNDEGKVVR